MTRVTSQVVASIRFQLLDYLRVSRISLSICSILLNRIFTWTTSHSFEAKLFFAAFICFLLKTSQYYFNFPDCWLSFWSCTLYRWSALVKKFQRSRLVSSTLSTRLALKSDTAATNAPCVLTRVWIAVTSSNTRAFIQERNHSPAPTATIVLTSLEIWLDTSVASIPKWWHEFRACLISVAIEKFVSFDYVKPVKSSVMLVISSSEIRIWEYQSSPILAIYQGASLALLLECYSLFSSNLSKSDKILSYLTVLWFVVWC